MIRHTPAPPSLQGLLEAHNDHVREHGVGRTCRLSFKHITALSRATGLLRPRWVALAAGGGGEAECPLFYTHAFLEHDFDFALSDRGPLAVAWDLAPFLGAACRRAMARALDAPLPRGALVRGALLQCDRAFDSARFPQARRRLGPQWEVLSRCHFIAPGGLAVCPPLARLLAPGDAAHVASVPWPEPLPPLPSTAAAAEAAPCADAALLARRVALDLKLRDGDLGDETCALLLLQPEPVWALARALPHMAQWAATAPERPAERYRHALLLRARAAAREALSPGALLPRPPQPPRRKRPRP